VIVPSAPPSTIPTLSEWALVLLGLALASLGAVAVRAGKRH